MVEACSQVGGFSPGVAARLLLAGGRRFFVKAVGVSRNPLLQVRTLAASDRQCSGLTFEELEAGFPDAGADPASRQRRGTAFEVLCVWLLRNDPLFSVGVARVWRWHEWPDRQGPDRGIDIVVQRIDDELWAVQCKADAQGTRSPRARWTVSSPLLGPPSHGVCSLVRPTARRPGRGEPSRITTSSCLAETRSSVHPSTGQRSSPIVPGFSGLKLLAHIRKWP